MTDDATAPRRSATLSPPGAITVSLVVTADDFGLGLATSRGIVRAHRHGPVTATSVMAVTGDHARRSVPLLADCPDLDVGLHLALTRCGERPLTARQSSGLTGRDGEFLPLPHLWARAVTGRLDRGGVADEIAAQAEAFDRLLGGRRPDYVDGHHHAHQLPVIRDALLDVVGHGLLPAVTRTTLEPTGIRWRVGSARGKRAVANHLGRRARAAFAQRWIWANDAFFGMLAPRDLRRPFPWSGYLANLPHAGVVEWCVHPGEPDDTLAGRDGYTAGRAVELDALTSPAGVAAWDHLRLNLARKSKLSHL